MLKMMYLKPQYQLKIKQAISSKLYHSIEVLLSFKSTGIKLPIKKQNKERHKNQNNT
jgi:hypothetical protein